MVGRLRIDPERREVVKNGAPVALTAREFDLLCALARRRATVLTRDQLLAACWPERPFDPRVVDVHVGHLRRKLEDDPARPRLLVTARGLGYKLVDPKEQELG